MSATDPIISIMRLDAGVFQETGLFLPTESGESFNPIFAGCRITAQAKQSPYSILAGIN
jgi:hypothetical protein